MALIKEWLPAFLGRHRARYRPGDWPTPGSEDEREFTRLWFAGFYEIRVLEHEADSASVRLGSRPPNFAREHLPAILAEVHSLRAANSQLGVGLPDTREEAERISRGCEYCGGSGLATVFHRLYAGSAVIEITYDDGRSRQFLGRVSAHCVCKAGRWMRSKFDDDMRKRIPDFGVVLAGGSRWLAEDPTLAAFVGYEMGEVAAVAEAVF